MLERQALAMEIAEQYAALPGVAAVALGGSQSSGMADPGSDIDLYVYTEAPLAPASREQIAGSRARHLEIDNQFWERGDEWIERESGLYVDIIIRDVAWIEAELDRVLVQHQASVGYSTAIWNNVLRSEVLVDRQGWFGLLQQRARQRYPEALRQAIIAKNYPILRSTQSSYLYQIERALQRDDVVSINHRVAALLASYFDVLFAVNRVPHPGEKRLVPFALRECARLPTDMPHEIEAVVRAGAASDASLIARIHTLLDSLDAVMDLEKG